MATARLSRASVSPLYDSLIPENKERARKIYNSFIEQGIDEQTSRRLMSRVLADSGGDPFNTFAGGGLISGLGLRANMFEDNEDREISRQVRQIADGVRSGSIDIAPENDIFSGVVGNYLGVGGPLWDPDKTMWSPVQGFVAPDEDTLALRQRYAESAFDDAAVSPRGAMGAYQIMPITFNEYSASTGETGDLLSPEFNRRVRDWYLGRLSNSRTITNGNPTDEVRLAKLYAAYNWGVGNLGNYLQSQKNAGVDIYNTMDWISGLPKETRDYVDFIVFGRDVPDTSKTSDAFNKAYDKFMSFADGGKIHIAPSKRGTFTAAATKNGKSVQAFASQVLAHKENYSPAMVKKANFARNAAKWHANGGPFRSQKESDAFTEAFLRRYDSGNENISPDTELRYEQPLEPQSGLNAAIAIAQPGSLLIKLMAPSVYKGMVKGLAEGEGADALLQNMLPAKIEGRYVLREKLKDGTTRYLRRSPTRTITLEDAINQPYKGTNFIWHDTDRSYIKDVLQGETRTIAPSLGINRLGDFNTRYPPMSYGPYKFVGDKSMLNNATIFREDGNTPVVNMFFDKTKNVSSHLREDMANKIINHMDRGHMDKNAIINKEALNNIDILPGHYAEAKYRGTYPLEKFKFAIFPEAKNAEDEAIISAFERLGLPIRTYKEEPGIITRDNRIEALLDMLEEHPEVLFKKGGTLKRIR